jgi:hypothetical protein
MSIDGGPDIIKDGLVLCLDAGNRNSYNSGSNNWLDLSINNNTGSLTNGPTFATTNNGIILFDGTNDYAPIGTASFPFGSSAGTISGWATTNSIAAGTAWIVSYGTAANNQSRFIGRLGSTYYFGGYNNDITAAGLQTGVWFNMVGVYNGTNASMYLNGVLVSGPTAKSWNTVVNNAQIGRQTGGSEYWSGNIAQVLIYNRALSATEVLQNYNANKGRFGL